MFYHKKCKTVAGSKHYDKFTPTDAQNTIGTKLMLVHRKLISLRSMEVLLSRAIDLDSWSGCVAIFAIIPALVTHVPSHAVTYYLLN